MSKLRRDLKDDTIPNKTTRGDQIIAACTGNAALGTITDDLAAFTTANTEAKSAYNTAKTARTDAEQLTGVQNDAEAAWDAAFEQLLVKLESNTKGDKTKLGTTTIATFEPGSAPALGAPAQVANVAVTLGDDAGELEVTWNANRPRPRLYVVRMGEDPLNEGTMQQVGMPSGSRFVKGGLTAGKKYWFQVAAVGSGSQQGPWSDPASGMAV